MDFFQGSIPPNFISFHLGNENTEEGPTPASDSNIQSTPNIMPSPPPFPPLRAPISPSSTDSNVDVTTYAEERDRVYEHVQGLTSTPNIDPAGKSPKRLQSPKESKEESQHRPKRVLQTSLPSTRSKLIPFPQLFAPAPQLQGFPIPSWK